MEDRVIKILQGSFSYQEYLLYSNHKYNLVLIDATSHDIKSTITKLGRIDRLFLTDSYSTNEIKVKTQRVVVRGPGLVQIVNPVTSMIEKTIDLSYALDVKMLSGNFLGILKPRIHTFDEDPYTSQLTIYQVGTWEPISTRSFNLGLIISISDQEILELTSKRKLTVLNWKIGSTRDVDINCPKSKLLDAIKLPEERVLTRFQDSPNLQIYSLVSGNLLNEIPYNNYISDGFFALSNPYLIVIGYTHSLEILDSRVIKVNNHAACNDVYPHFNNKIAIKMESGLKICEVLQGGKVLRKVDFIKRSVDQVIPIPQLYPDDKKTLFFILDNRLKFVIPEVLIKEVFSFCF
jgi:hypothetical protein